jgi:phospholipase C
LILITPTILSPPYGKQVFPTVESGSRPIRGDVTEGRKLAITTSTDGQVVQLNGTAISTSTGTVSSKRDTSKSPIKFAKNSLFKLVVTDTKGHFKIQSVATPNSCITTTVGNNNGIATGDCKTTNWYFERNGAHHHIRESVSNLYLNINGTDLHLAQDQQTLFKVYSVTE